MNKIPGRTDGYLQRKRVKTKEILSFHQENGSETKKKIRVNVFRYIFCISEIFLFIGIKTSQDNKFYTLSSKFPSFSNEGKSLVLQFQVKHEQTIDCGGGYLKLHPSNIDQKLLDGETPYHIMFGPDICGSLRKLHIIFNYNGRNLQRKNEISFPSDEYSHLCTLLVHSNNTYEAFVDGESVAKGALEDDFDHLPPKFIDKVGDTKPADWDDQEFIPDPTHVKPEGYDEVPEYIVDKSQAKPEDWNVEEDGEWEPPMIENPEYKGEWTQRTMKNPNYKGVWKPAQVSNPDYVPDEELYKYSDIGAVSIEIWQVKSGTIFDNILVGDDMVEAEKYAESTFYPLAEKEKQLRDEHFEASKPPETFRDEPEGEGDDEDGDEEPEGDSSSEKDEL
ncbi:hypothetical protein Zmor_011922 [Zophobas morio]|uniref:Calreticulin n=1 Tax=Zophobas morio TaxID=2755281 RepID=A0AA38HGU5_9CUCU|nr:hypothetical protein Zmor_011922 [Zophobas morio]